MVEPFEQGICVQLITSLAGIVCAQHHAAYPGELLGRDSRVVFVLQLSPELLVESAAVHYGDVFWRRAGLHMDDPANCQRKTRGQCAGPNRGPLPTLAIAGQRDDLGRAYWLPDLP